MMTVFALWWSFQRLVREIRGAGLKYDSRGGNNLS